MCCHHHKNQRNFNNSLLPWTCWPRHLQKWKGIVIQDRILRRRRRRGRKTAETFARGSSSFSASHNTLMRRRANLPTSSVSARFYRRRCFRRRRLWVTMSRHRISQLSCFISWDLDYESDFRTTETSFFPQEPSTFLGGRVHWTVQESFW